MTQNTKATLKIILLFAFFFAVSTALQNIFGFKAENIESLIKSFGILAPAAYSFLLFLGLTVPFNPLSDYLVISIAALIFPKEVAIVSTFVSHASAVTVNYAIGNKIGWQTFLKFEQQEQVKKVKEIIKNITIRKVFILRFVLPLTSIGVDLVGLASGFARLPFSRYLAASLIPWTIYNVTFFTTASYIKEQSLPFILIPALVLVVAALGIFYLLKK